MTSLNFKLEALDPSSSARAGMMQTGHGQVETPIFMPVGTVGSVKAVSHQQLKQVIHTS